MHLVVEEESLCIKLPTCPVSGSNPYAGGGEGGAGGGSGFFI